jgi:hypothetical protein
MPQHHHKIEKTSAMHMKNDALKLNMCNGTYLPFI